MNPQTKLTEHVLPDSQTVETSRLYLEGIIAGFVGAATIAIWFLILDSRGKRKRRIWHPLAIYRVRVRIYCRSPRACGDSA